MRGFGLRRAGRPADRDCSSAAANAVGVAWIGKLRAIDAAELFGARMHMDERHLRPRNIEQRVALRRQFAEPPADQDDQIGDL